MPRYSLNFSTSIVILFIFFSFCVVTIILIYIVLSIYVFVGYKLLPIFQNTYFSLTQIKSAIPALDRTKIQLNESKILLGKK